MSTTPQPLRQIPRRKKWRRRFFRATIAAAIGIATLCAADQIAIRFLPFPDAKLPRPAALIEDRNGIELAAFVNPNDDFFFPLTSDEISPHLKKAIIAVEDRRFENHHGIDWLSAGAAALQDLRALSAKRGASTLSMQVARLRENQGHGWFDKPVQAFRAQQLELHESKDEILTEYINRAPFGGNLVGAGAASWRYFGKACRDLSLGQAALLAGLPQSPTRFRPDKSPDLARARRAHVLGQMLATAAITQDDYTRALNEPLDVRSSNSGLPGSPFSPPRAPGALPALADFASTHPGKTRTTLDAHIQQTAAQILSDHWQNLTAQNVDSAAIIIIDVPTGEILASLSRSTVAPSVDLTTAPRSTGSILKPFIYAAAFDAGIVSPSTQLLDSPKAWAGYVPSNFDREFAGPIAAADALAESRNIPAMILLAKVGIDRTIGLLHQLGIASPARSGRRYGLSLAIGGAEATPREVAEAYATLARGGGHVLAHMGAGAPPLRVIIPAQACWQTLAALSRQGRTEGVDPAAAAQHVAWKTGTSNGLRDAWCAAATRQCVVVVWLGNAQGRGAPALIGQEAAAPLALKIITQVDSTPCPPWPSAENKEITATPLVGNTKLSIVSPVSGTEILTDGTGPAAVILQCAGGEGTERWWFANGELVGMGNQENMEWKPAPGTYELRVIDRAGNGASLRVNVR